MTLKLIEPGRRKGNQFFLVRGRLNGQDIEESTETTDPAQASIYLKRCELRVLEQKPRAKGAEFTYGDADDAYRILKEVHPDSDTAKTLDAIKRTLGERTAAHGITSNDLKRAAIKLYGNHLQSTRNRMVIGPAAAVLHAASEDGKIPWVRYKRFPETETEPRPAAPVTAKLLAANTAGYKRLLVLFLFDHGWRIGELTRITWQHIDMEAGTIAHGNSKANEWTRLPLHPEVLEALRSIPEAEREGRLFPWATRSGVYKWLRPLTRKLRVTFTPHMARHSFATWIVDEGGDDYDLEATKNWKDPKSRRRYTKVSRDRAKAALSKLKGIG